MTHKDFLQHVGMELRVARVRRNLMATEVAKMTGLTTDTVLSVEKGMHDTRILTIKRIADALGVSMKDIM